MNDLAVIVTCHEPYLKWLPAAIDSINRQQPQPAECVVVFDRCRPIDVEGSHWRSIQCDCGHPAEVRNIGLAATQAAWLIFWDADDVMAPGYLAAMQRAIEQGPADMGIYYPDIQFCDEQLGRRDLWSMPAWDYWRLRAENYISSPSGWRRAALESVGGWSDRTFALLDFALALDVTARGWKAAKLNGPPILVRTHANGLGQQLRNKGKLLNDLWKARSTAIISLLAGRDATFEHWRKFLLQAELPPHTALYIVDNSGRPEFTQRVYSFCHEMMTTHRFLHLDFTVYGEAYPHKAGEAYLARARHAHVAHLYSAVFARITEDLIFTLEDDMEPPLDAVRVLGEEIGYLTREKIGAVAGVYAMPHNPAEVCAGLGNEHWEQSIRRDEVTNGRMNVGFVGGACTVWAHWAIGSYPIHLQWDTLLGWDGVLCRAMRRQGYRIYLHAGVDCKHHTHGIVNDQSHGATPLAAIPPTEALATVENKRTARSLRFDELATQWRQALHGDPSAQEQWRTDPDGRWGQTEAGGDWAWQANGVTLRSSGRAWSSLCWAPFNEGLMRELSHFAVAVTVTGEGDAAGISFGDYKDFLVRLRTGASHRLQLVVDLHSGFWAFQVDGHRQARQWWTGAVHHTESLAHGVFAFKACNVENALFHDLVIESAREG